MDLDFAPVHAVDLVHPNLGNGSARMSDAPATKADFERLIELIANIERGLVAMKADLANFATKDDLAALRGELMQHTRDEIATGVRSIDENFKAQFGALDDKIAAVDERSRTDLGAHVTDTRIHVTPAAPKRARRARTKRR